MYASSSVLHNYCEIALEFNSWAVLPSLLHTSKFQLVTSRDLKGERQVYVFHLPVEVGFLPFYYMDSLSLTQYLVAAESKILKESSVQDVRQNSELCRRLKQSVGKLVFAYQCGENVGWFRQDNKHYILHIHAKPYRDSILHILMHEDLPHSRRSGVIWSRKHVITQL